jgi:hypothetical protein
MFVGSERLKLRPKPPLRCGAAALPAVASMLTRVTAARAAAVIRRADARAPIQLSARDLNGGIPTV